MNDLEPKNLWQGLKCLWQGQKPSGEPALTADEQIAAMRKKMAQLHRGLNKTDLVFLALEAVIIVVFTIYFFTIPYFVTRIGVLILIAGDLFASWKTIQSRRSTPQPIADAPVMEWLKYDLAKVHQQAELSRTVLWWYLLPFLIGMNVFFWGFPLSFSIKIGPSVLTALIAAVTYWLHQRTRRKQWLPLQQELEALEALLCAEEFAALPEEQSVNPASTIVPSAPPPIHADAQTAGTKRKSLGLLGELLVVAGVLGVGFLAWKLGMFMNFIFVLLMLLAPVNVVRLAWRAWKRRIYFGLFTRPFALESRKYWWPCLARIACYLSCGDLLSIAIVPFQFPDLKPGGMLALVWTLVGLQVALACLPAKRVSLPAAGLFSFSTIFMVWQFIQIASPVSGETILLSSPLPGVSCVVQGGNSSLINHHYALRSQRYAVDLFKVAETIEAVGDWKILGMDASFGQTILSPCNGRVAQVEDWHPDNTKGETNTQNPAGNYVTIEIAQGRYILIAHLKSRSITVKPGDEVKLGQAIAQCGNSGNTSGPHVHLQAQSSPTFSLDAQTFPIAFRDVVRKGEHRTNLQPRRNDLLLQADSRAALPLLWAAGPSLTNALSGPLPADTGQALEVIRKKYDFPALAVVVVKDGKICDRAAVGVRKSGDPTLVTTNDQFHIGSCTKSMTATLAAMFIEEGKLRWDTTIAEVFPELKGKMDKRYEDVTIEQLLTHRGGVPGKPPGAAWKRAWKQQGTPMEQRQEFIAAILAAPPEAAPGKKKIYSNQGYAVVGGMMEKITGRPWEELITEKLFKPLRMDSAGFGPPGKLGQVDQPWGHVSKLFTTLPLQEDNPPAISPAGRVHCSLDDLARYAMLHLEGERDGNLLEPETFRKLHTAPAGGDYACGWVCLRRGWAGGRALMHNGSNTMWYVVMWLAPEKDFAVIAATNTGADKGQDGCNDVAVAMIKKWLGVTP